MPAHRTSRKPALVYVPLEPVASRYTHGLCNEATGWMPTALRAPEGDTTFWREVFFLDPKLPDLPADIRVGAVLDAVGRGRYAMAQIDALLVLVQRGKVVSGDVVYLQDFWTPGLEALYYALDLMGVDLKIHAMVHAQSVDPHDFTYAMRRWIRPVELGYANRMTSLFVASSIHKQQLETAGFRTPISVVGLPFGARQVFSEYADRAAMTAPKEQVVIYTSRLDAEKNPDYMLRVAKRFLAANKSWRWKVTTSAQDFRSYNNSMFITRMNEFAAQEPRFVLCRGLTKADYYHHLQTSAIQFNCSYQDYVSWTALEAALFGCDLCYPHFGSFPEFLPHDNLYHYGLNFPSQDDALHVLEACVRTKATHRHLPAFCDHHRDTIARVVAGMMPPGINIWTHYDRKKGVARK